MMIFDRIGTQVVHLLQLNLLVFPQDGKKKLKSSVVGMFLEYVVQTLEDDFHVKSSAFAQSIAKATLSCNHQFSHVRLV